MMTTAHKYAAEQSARFQEQFCDLIRIPSISTDPAFAEKVKQAADWIVADMEKIGLSAEQITMPEGRHPLVLGQWNGAGDDAPTVLIYCHYDVQPAVVADGWDTEPFEPTIKDGKIYARGATDSKVHVVSWLKAVESLLATEGSPVNIKLLFEGEEESGGDTIKAFVAQQPERITADTVVISDGVIRDIDQPSITYGLRGIVTMEVHVQGPQSDLHSGHFGGVVHNPVQAITEIIAQLHDENGAVAVPGFYDNVAILDDEERALLAESNMLMEEEWRKVANPPAKWGEHGYNMHERIGARPTLEINGLYGGYTGEGFKTVLPASAHAKISCRLVANQDPARIAQLVQDHIQILAPQSVTVSFSNVDVNAAAVVLDREKSAIKAAASAYEKGWGKKPLFERAGGSVPITYDMLKISDNLTIMGFSYKGGTAHGPNENIPISSFQNGINTAIHFLQDVNNT